MSTAQHKLRRAGLSHYFEFGGYASDHPERSEFIRIAVERASTLYEAQFAPEQVVVIGDTPYDIKAALHHGFRVIAVGTGGIAQEKLHAAGAHLVTADLTNAEHIQDFIRS